MLMARKPGQQLFLSEENPAPDLEERNLLPRRHLVDRTLADAEILCGFTGSEKFLGGSARFSCGRLGSCW